VAGCSLVAGRSAKAAIRSTFLFGFCLGFSGGPADRKEAGITAIENNKE
jgi:hypothetical protein